MEREGVSRWPSGTTKWVALSKANSLCRAALCPRGLCADGESRTSTGVDGEDAAQRRRKARRERSAREESAFPAEFWKCGAGSEPFNFRKRKSPAQLRPRPQPLIEEGVLLFVTPLLGAGCLDPRLAELCEQSSFPKSQTSEGRSSLKGDTLQMDGG